MSVPSQAVDNVGSSTSPSDRLRGARFRLAGGLLVTLALLSGSLTATAQEETTTTTTTMPPTSTSEPTTTVAETSSTSATQPDSTEAEDNGENNTSSTASEPAASSSTENSEERARAVANLSLAKAADVEIAAQLNEINKSANTTLEKIDEANSKIDAADAVLNRTAEELENSGDRQNQIESDLRVKAVEGFKTRSLGQINPILTDMDVTRALRQHSLLAQASLSTAELLEELRGLLEERRVANARATRAKSAAETAQRILEEELDRLKGQQADQLTLKAEAERRIDDWAAELNAYAREDAAIQQVIAENTTKAPVETAVNNPTSASIAGFQWPIDAPATSEYGWRVHPIFGRQKFHNGIDLGAAGGTPIAAANSGVVIFAGWQRGYGNTVMVDHGGGITTLYAHQSRLGSSVGQLVDRGDIIGFVGSTGNSTGNHLHLEFRVNGSATNPRNYLP